MPEGRDKEARPRRDYRRRPKRKVCSFCAEKATRIDYKDTGRLRRFVTERERSFRGGYPEIAHGTSGCWRWQSSARANWRCCLMRANDEPAPVAAGTRIPSAVRFAGKGA